MYLYQYLYLRAGKNPVSKIQRILLYSERHIIIAVFRYAVRILWTDDIILYSYI